MPLAPARVLDTRNNLGATGPLAAQAVTNVQIAGHGGIPTTGVSAVVINLTAVTPTKPGYITAWPTGTTKPTASNLNFTAAQTIPNLVIVPLGTNGKISLFNGSAGTTHLIADIAGYYLAGTPTTPGAYTPLTPARVLDTRNNLGATGPLAAQAVTNVQIAGHGGIPTTGVSAVVINLTAVTPTKPGYITAWPTGTTKPTASNLNFTAAQTIPNLVIVPLGTNGKISLFNGSAGTTHLIADIAGYYLAGTPTTPGAYTPLTPARVLDTRNNLGATGPLAAQAVTNVQIAGHGGIPTTGVSAVVINLTAVTPTKPGYITAWPTGTTKPTASNLNFTAAQTIPNLVIVPLGTNGKISLFNGSAGTTHLIADIAGYYLAAAPVVSALSATSGPAAGSTRVKLTGSNFAQVNSVTFGGVPGTDLTVTSASSLSVTAPPHSAGTVHVVVTTASGSSAAGASDQFTYISGQYTVQIGISAKTVANAGGWANALAGAQTMIAAVNNTFNDPANHLTLHYNFVAMSITQYNDMTSAEAEASHPNSNLRLLLADDSDIDGGWYSGTETIVDWWHYLDEHAFSQNSIDGTVHEFGHSRGAIDEYGLDVPSGGNPIDSTPFAAPEPSIMTYPYGVHTFDIYSQGIINREGDTLENTRPETVAAQVIPASLSISVNRGGLPLTGASVHLYQVAWFSNTVNPAPGVSATTGTNGAVALPGNLFGQGLGVDSPWNIQAPMFLVTVDYAGSHTSTWFNIIDASVYSFGHPGEPYVLSVTG